MSQAQAAQHWPDPVNMKLSEPGLASRLSRKARKLRSKWFRLTASDLLLFITGERASLDYVRRYFVGYYITREQSVESYSTYILHS